MGNLSTSHDYNIEINPLKSKLDRFAENVSTKLDDLAFEINHIKKNRPYSVVILEDVINELKKEKLELRRLNDDQHNVGVVHSESLAASCSESDTCYGFKSYRSFAVPVLFVRVFKFTHARYCLKIKIHNLAPLKLSNVIFNTFKLDVITGGKKICVDFRLHAKTFSLKSKFQNNRLKN